VGREVLNVLADTKSTSSPTATEILNTLPLEEQTPVMEGIISHLRQTSDWTRKPKGYAGACLLARHSSDAAKVFVRYIQELDLGDKQPAWMMTQLKDEQWYKEV